MKTVNERILSWSVELLLAALFWSWSLLLLSILYPPMWFSKKSKIFCDISAHWNSCVMLIAELARILGTPDRSENKDHFSLQSMMSFHNVDEIHSCFLSAQLFLLFSTFLSHWFASCMFCSSESSCFEWTTDMSETLRSRSVISRSFLLSQEPLSWNVPSLLDLKVSFFYIFFKMHSLNCYVL